MSPKSKLSTHFLAIALISATSSLFQLSFCGDSAILSNRKSSLTSLSDSEERPLPNRSDKNLSSRSRTSPARDHYFDRYFDRSRDRSGGGGRREHEYQSRQNAHDPMWGGKMMNKFRHRTNPLLSAASAMGFAHESFGHVDDDDVGDNEAAGSSHGGGYGGGGGGGYGKGVNKSAVGLLGFLSLLSLIQSGLTTTTAAGGGGRRKRSINGTILEETDFENVDIDPVQKIEREAQSQKIAEIVMPLMTTFSFAMQDDQVAEQKLKCVLNEVCSSNHKLVAEFGEHGKDVGLMLGNVLESMAKKMRLVKGSGVNDHILKLKYAARTGRNGKNCEAHYPKCD